MSNLDPVISKLEADGDVVTIIDTRTEAGTRALFGGTNPAACLYAKGDFIECQGRFHRQESGDLPEAGQCLPQGAEMDGGCLSR